MALAQPGVVVLLVKLGCCTALTPPVIGRAIAQLQADAEHNISGHSAESFAERCVSRPFSSWNRSILTEIYLRHACSCQ
eukprot:COSAG01_NODE_7456_length_3204_cov_2.374557_1_plen_79_part_00